MSAIKYPVGFTCFNVSCFLSHEINQDYYLLKLFLETLTIRQIKWSSNSL